MVEPSGQLDKEPRVHPITYNKAYMRSRGQRDLRGLVDLLDGRASTAVRRSATGTSASVLSAARRRIRLRSAGRTAAVELGHVARELRLDLLKLVLVLLLLRGLVRVHPLEGVVADALRLVAVSRLEFVAVVVDGVLDLKERKELMLVYGLLDMGEP